MFNILCHQGNTNQKSLRFHLTSVRMTIINKLRRGGANALMMRLKITKVTTGISMEVPQKSPRTWLFYSWVYAKRNPSQHTTEITAHQCVLQHYSQ